MVMLLGMMVSTFTIANCTWTTGSDHLRLRMTVAATVPTASTVMVMLHDEVGRERRLSMDNLMVVMVPSDLSGRSYEVMVVMI